MADRDYEMTRLADRLIDKSHYIDPFLAPTELSTIYWLPLTCIHIAIFTRHPKEVLTAFGERPRLEKRVLNV